MVELIFVIFIIFVKQTSPEEGRRRATGGSGQRPNVPARPSTKPKHLVTVKSDSSVGAKVNGKPPPQPKTKEGIKQTVFIKCTR